MAGFREPHESASGPQPPFVATAKLDPEHVMSESQPNSGIANQVLGKLQGQENRSANCGCNMNGSSA